MHGAQGLNRLREAFGVNHSVFGIALESKDVNTTATAVSTGSLSFWHTNASGAVGVTPATFITSNVDLFCDPSFDPQPLLAAASDGARPSAGPAAAAQDAGVLTVRERTGADVQAALLEPVDFVQSPDGPSVLIRGESQRVATSERELYAELQRVSAFAVFASENRAEHSVPTVALQGAALVPALPCRTVLQHESKRVFT